MERRSEEKKRKLIVWVDAGTHFRNGFFLHSLFGNSEDCLRHKFDVSLNFWAEGHGKSEVDGEFGVLAGLVKRKGMNIETIEDLKNFFEREGGVKKAGNNDWNTKRKFVMFVPFCYINPSLSLFLSHYFTPDSNQRKVNLHPNLCFRE